MLRALSIAWLFIVGIALNTPGAIAAEPTAVETTITTHDSGLSDLVTGLVRANLPDNYEKKKNWGNQTNVFDGLHVKRDGLRLDTKRK